MDSFHLEDGGQLPAGEVRAGPPGAVPQSVPALLPPPGAAGGRDRLPAAGDRHRPAGGAAGGPEAVRPAGLCPGFGGAGGRHCAGGGGAADGLHPSRPGDPGHHSPRPAGRGLRGQQISLPAAACGGGVHDQSGHPAGAGRGHRFRDFPGQPEDRHPLDYQGGQYPPAHRLCPERQRQAAAYRHPSDQSGQGQRPGDGPPRRRKRPAGHRPPAYPGGAQRGGRGAGPGPGDRTAGVFQVHPRLSGPVLPVASAVAAGGAAAGSGGGFPLLLQPQGGSPGPGYGGRYL